MAEEVIGHGGDLGQALALFPDAPEPRLDLFTATHEFVHLLQARRLVPRGEKMADLEALARDVGLIDRGPSYLKIPRRAFERDGRPRPGMAPILHRLAVEIRREAPTQPRRAVRLFEERVVSLVPPPGLLEILTGGLWRRSASFSFATGKRTIHPRSSSRAMPSGR